MGYIYKITNIINGKLYIGQTKKTIEERFQTHLKNWWASRPHTIRPKALNKDVNFLQKISVLSSAN